jgi:hypothetical protein
MAIKTLTKEIVRNIHSSLSRPANVLVWNLNFQIMIIKSSNSVGHVWYIKINVNNICFRVWYVPAATARDLRLSSLKNSFFLFIHNFHLFHSIYISFLFSV